MSSREPSNRKKLSGLLSLLRQLPRCTTSRILIIQDYLKKVTVMVDKLLQPAYAVSKLDMYIQLLNIHDNLSYKHRLVKLVEETGDLVTKNRNKHDSLGMQSDLKVKLCDRLKMLRHVPPTFFWVTQPSKM